MPEIRFVINGYLTSACCEPETPLLHLLRGVGCTSVRPGCLEGACGSCTVLVDGQPVQSCRLHASQISERSVTSVEGLAGKGSMSRLQQAFCDHQAAQCGYCISGMLIAATALLLRIEHPSRPEIIKSLEGHLCRCGTHPRIVRAIEAAAANGVAVRGEQHI